MASSVGSNFQPIKSWEEITPFANRLVAYQTNSNYLGGSAGYKVGNIYFGFIEPFPFKWDTGEKGYSMKQLLKPKSIECHCALIDSKLQSGLLMRLATKEEVALISKAVTDDQAIFAFFIYKNRMQKIFESLTSKL